MKKRWKWKLIAFFAVLASLLLLGGCKFQYTLEEKREETGMTACVTYYSNGSGAAFGVGKTVNKLYFAGGSRAINIGVDRVTNGTIDTPTWTNYTLLGWYEAKTDVDGNVLRDEEGKVLLQPKAFDFTQRLKDGDDIVLYAKWQKNEAVNVYFVCDELDDNATVTLEDGKAIKNKEFIDSKNYQKTDNTRPYISFDNIPDVNGYTPYEYYADAACTQPVNWPLERGRDGDCKIYLKYIPGDWTILKTAENVESMFKTTEKKNYYLANDINLEGKSVSCLATFSSYLQGNGFTIKNLTVSGGSKIKDATVSTFGQLTENAKMENVTFENLTFKVSMQGRTYAKAFIFCSSITETAIINNVSLTGTIKMDITREKESILVNMERSGEWYFENVLFGGFTTDQAAIDGGLDIKYSKDNVVIDRSTEEIYIDK